jgi:hypothetical protein
MMSVSQISCNKNSNRKTCRSLTVDLSRESTVFEVSILTVADPRLKRGITSAITLNTSNLPVATQHKCLFTSASTLLNTQPQMRETASQTQFAQSTILLILKLNLRLIFLNSHF